MPIDAEEEKLGLIDRLALECGPGLDAGFLRAFYRNVAAEDLLRQPPEHLVAAAASLWDWMTERRPGKAKIRVLADRAWAAGRTIIEISNDDMPFLVDSVTAALHRTGHAVHLVIHPVLPVARDPGGRLVALDGEVRESAMQIQLAEALDAGAREAVAAELTQVLEDVRIVVADWAAMRRKAEEIAGALAVNHLPISAAELAETAAFLTWLADDNFLFLGYREYSFGGSGLEVVPQVGRGLLRDDGYLVFEGLRDFTLISPEVQQFLRSPRLLMVSKSNRKSTVHRWALLDAILIKTFDASGAVSGQRLLIGLFTSTAYGRPPASIPMLRRKVRRCLDQSGFSPDSHDGKALQHVIDSFPRDELFQIDEHDLSAITLGVLHLEERPRVALYVRRDPFERFASCFVYLPNERYSEPVREALGDLLVSAFNGRMSASSVLLGDASSLVRLHFTIETPGGHKSVDLAKVERDLVEAGRSWADRLGEALVKTHSPQRGQALLARFGEALPSAYTERFSADDAVADIDRLLAIEAGAPVTLSLYRTAGDGAADLRLKIYHPREPVALSDVLPMLENLGLRVINEIPFECRPARGFSIWIQEFQLTPKAGGAIDLAQSRARFEEAFPQVWSGALEDDGFNRLILRAGLSARQVVVLRTYAKVMRQAGSSFSQAYMEDTASAHPQIARLLIGLFEGMFDPALTGDRAAAAGKIETAILGELDRVTNLDEDRILRGFLLLIRKSLRTNYYQAGPKPYLSIKLSSHEIDLLPLPRPLVEIYVYSPRMEGCHLRGGKVARGGIRWSDRKEDFRTEILGLMKAQMVKNAVIVPVGSKGGFVVKRPPATGGRDALMAEVVECYRTLMYGILDITDTIDGAAIVPPADVVRLDGDDPYLVVAADKGTATFSDIANGVAIDYGFWLGDAFASGGSVGYDHKAMGITAKGAWEAVKRHFRELGTDIQTTDFTCVGVGDMSGDVFGNGMLLSQHTRLIAAFDHRHIFIDPDPDPAKSWEERKRLFALPRSSWADYDRSLLSAGGAIIERGAKSITLSPEAAAVLGLTEAPMSPAVLIQALLRQPVDLLWFGGIGTYVKAAREAQSDAGDRANDALRVDAATLRAKVIGEGANLAMTQRGRIEYAQKGGRLNTDAIDNSAGVDTSDHEVNIKIAVGGMIASGKVAPADRAAFLAEMTDEVGTLVLRDNYLQTQALSLAEAESVAALDQHVRLMRGLERAGKLDRAIEFLSDDETIEQYAAAKRGLSRPELAVLLAYAKNALYAELLTSDLPDAPEFEADLLAYFPSRMRSLAPDDLNAHRLRREIIATQLANAILNRMGPAFVEELQAKTGCGAADIARAYRIVCDVFGLPTIWQEIESLDNAAPAGSQTRLLFEVKTVAERAVRWLLQSGLKLDIAPLVAEFQPGIGNLAAKLPGLLPESERKSFESRKARFLHAGVPEALAERVVALANLAAGLDIVRIDGATGIEITEMGRLYYETGERFGLDQLRDIARAMPATTSWQRLAAGAVLDDLYVIQGEIAQRALGAGHGPATERLDLWVEARSASAARIQEMVAEIGRAPSPDLAMLTVAARQLRAMTG